MTFAGRLCGLLLLFLSPALAQVTKPTLDQLIDEALGRNLRLIAERYNIPIAEARIIQARLRPNPTLLMQWQYIDAFGIGFSAEKNPAGPPELDGGLMLPIVRGGKRAARIEAARFSKATAEADFLNTSRMLMLDIQMAYVDLLLSQANLRLYQASEDAFRKITAVMEARVKAGDLAKVELVRTEVALIQFQNLGLQASQRVRIAKQRLQALIGREKFDPAFEVDGDFRKQRLSLPPAAALDQALQSRPDLLSARQDINRARSFLALQQATAKQDWTLLTWVNRQYNIGVRNGTSLTTQMNVPLPISDRNQGEIERAKQEMTQAEARVKAIEHDIRVELEAAIATHETAHSLVERIESGMMPRAQQALEIMQYSYTRGEATLVEFLDAQRAFNDTAASLNEALAENTRTLYIIDTITSSGKK